MDQKKCKQIEELILKQSSESLSKQESNWVETHLSNCVSCRAFSISAKKIAKAMVVEPEASLHPDPAIRENIIRRMEVKSENKQNVLYDIFDTLRNILSYRIPLYQAALAIVIIFITLFGFDFSNLWKDGNRIESVNSQEIIYPANDQFMETNHPELSQQKVGINVREDSILARFIYRSM